MTLEEMKQSAFDLVRTLTDADCLPVICDEVMAIVERNQRAGIWAASTAYEFGDIVQLSPRNGHRYTCITAGTSATTFVAFPTATNYYTREGYSVADGTVVWQQVGADYTNVFDIRAAVHEGWMLKAGKASLLIDQAGVSASQLQSQCRLRAADYIPVGVA